MISSIVTFLREKCIIYGVAVPQLWPILCVDSIGKSIKQIEKYSKLVSFMVLKLLVQGK